MSKPLKYIVLIITLLALNLWLFFADADSNSSTASERYFDADDLERVSMIQFDVDGKTVKLKRSEQGWMLNDMHKADEGFMSTLISILQRVEAGRTITNWDGQILGEVEVEFDFNSRYRFQFASNPKKTKSYFIQEGVAKEVAVPGYRDNVIDLFTLHPDQWMDRLIFDGTWRTIQKLQTTFIDGSESFEIKFDDKFFLVDGNTPKDSTAVINYLNQFEYFQANELISKGRFSNFDSLSATTPLATITLDDIKNEEPTVLTVFPALAGQQFHLLVKDGEQQMVVDARRVGAMLRKPD